MRIKNSRSWKIICIVFTKLKYWLINNHSIILNQVLRNTRGHNTLRKILSCLMMMIIIMVQGLNINFSRKVCVLYVGYKLCKKGLKRYIFCFENTYGFFCVWTQYILFNHNIAFLYGRTLNIMYCVLTQYIIFNTTSCVQTQYIVFRKNKYAWK